MACQSWKMSWVDSSSSFRVSAQRAIRFKWRAIKCEEEQVVGQSVIGKGFESLQRNNRQIFSVTFYLSIRFEIVTQFAT